MSTLLAFWTLSKPCSPTLFILHFSHANLVSVVKQHFEAMAKCWAYLTSLWNICQRWFFKYFACVSFQQISPPSPSPQTPSILICSHFFSQCRCIQLAEQENVSTVLATLPTHISLSTALPSSTHIDPPSETNTFCMAAINFSWRNLRAPTTMKQSKQ